MGAPDRASDWVGRLALLGFGFLLAALLLELVLQVGAVWHRSEEGMARGRSGWEGDAHRVLCVGDSNTYGVFVDPEDAYPAQLERLWNQSGSQPHIQVMNLGYPGTDSSALAAQLPHLLDTLSPDTLLVMIGVNDSWTRAHRIEAGEKEASAGARGIAKLRIARLFAVLSARVANPTGAEQYAAGMAPGSDVGMGRDLPVHLDAILAIAREHGVRPVLVTYPSSRTEYAVASQQLREAGSEHGTRVVDVARVFGKKCPTAACDLLLPDGHPSVAGYRVVAETLVERRAIRRVRDHGRTRSRG